MTDLCVKCKTKPIHIKSRGLCEKCSREFYHDREKERKGCPSPWHHKNKVRIRSEVEFIRNYFEHKNWVYHPAIFRVNGKKYEPDFYDGEHNVFIEVSGTHQAFYANRDKYHEFIRAYPKIKYEIRTVIGTLIPLNASIKGTYPTAERPEKK